VLQKQLAQNVQGAVVPTPISKVVFGIVMIVSMNGRTIDNNHVNISTDTFIITI
jgi:hypothetical protein